MGVTAYTLPIGYEDMVAPPTPCSKLRLPTPVAADRPPGVGVERIQGVGKPAHPGRVCAHCGQALCQGLTPCGVTHMCPSSP